MSGLSLWREPRPVPPPPPRGWRDYALVGVILALIALEAMLRPDMPLRTVSLLVTAGLAPTLLWRRDKPLLMVAIAFGVSGLAPFLTGGVPPETNTMVFVLLLPFSLFRWGSGREILFGTALVLGKLVLSVGAGQLALGDSLAGLAILSAVATAGVALRYRAGARARELDRIRLLEREQLARDLHDTVAHHVSAMAIRAQAGLVTSAGKPEAATDALKLIEAEATRALAEMRSMVRVLRQGEPADYTPSPGSFDVRWLSVDKGASGAPVNVDVDGDLTELPASLSAAIYRMAQESVTNAHRHAREATRVDVRVTVDIDAVRLRVADDGSADSGAGKGYGMMGMRERAQLLGGSFHAGPDPGGGWVVTVELPLTGPAT